MILTIKTLQKSLLAPWQAAIENICYKKLLMEICQKTIRDIYFSLLLALVDNIKRSKSFLDNRHVA